MAEKILMLALSPTMETGTIAQWKKSEGNGISSGDVICEVETDKATIDYESTQEGVLRKILVESGGQAAVGEAIGIIAEKDEDISDLLKEIEKQTSKTPGNEKKPAEKKKTEPVEPPVYEDESTAEKPSPAAEKPKDVKQAGPKESSAAVHPSESEAAPAKREPGTTSPVKASPLARSLAEQAGLSLSAIQGSGPGGRVVKKDVEAAAARAPEQPAAGQSSVGAATALKDESIPVSQKRRIIAQRLAESKFSAPHYYLKARVIVDDLLAARAEINASSSSHYSLNAFLITFAALTLKRHPMINAGWQGDTIKKFGSIDIGLAVALDDGLIVPIVRNCAGKGIMTIDRELKELIEKARNGKLQPEEFSGATFTISNLGAFAIEDFTAIINPPGSAILAVGRIQREVIPGENDELIVCSTMRLTLSCDHRVIDGAVGAAFLDDLKNMIESPVRALL